ncbi:MAG: hypothetical protein VYA30_12315 [Myxococcota bacterium]|nr:hypothetical protein [Myxococcota bacterium]
MRLVHIILLAVLASSFGCSSELDDSNIPDYRDPKSEFGPPVMMTQDAPKGDAPNTPPKIVRVRWQSAEDCSTDTISPVQFAIEVDGASDQATELIFDGAVSGCDSEANRFGSMINGPRVRLSCHHVSVHRAFLTVVDQQGRGDSLAFQFGPCSRGVIDTH